MNTEIENIIHQLQKSEKILVKQGNIIRTELEKNELMALFNAALSSDNSIHLDEKDLKYVSEMKNLKSYDIRIETWKNDKELAHQLSLVFQEIRRYQHLFCHITVSLGFSLAEYCTVTDWVRLLMSDDGDFCFGMKFERDENFALKLFILAGYEL
ncbi:hypothetical protein [Pasteurella bettyae]|uniref:Toxin-antitoxin system, antitoxin component, PHD domain protein n=1 Tax=Pasteurella bettyae CCUG 2042 TaxID=1095749 RepID=I3DFE4_9PAST|nr:hypothetical protein [Pasteurella bettyae]EIJ70437.1 toxin-antitoxin system, antitoxin component, PHD domain protein [Pasteurella bettyae CCUG 2042]SUB21090.1 Uncharacterised protein [Pasteurella bettyae]